MHQLTSSLVEQGVLFKREEKCKNDTQSNWPKYFQRLEHMQWAQGLHVGLLVQEMWRFVKTGMEHIKSQFKKTKKEKNAPLSKIS